MVLLVHAISDAASTDKFAGFTDFQIRIRIYD